MSTTNLYVASSVYFNNYENKAACFISGGCIAITIFSIVRLLSLTNAGQYLASRIKASAHTLDRTQMKKPIDGTLDTVHLLKKDLNDLRYFPINPFSAFSLSNGTLIATFSTILTYLIILIQFKATEDEEKTTLLNDMQHMLQKLLRNNSNITGL